MKKLLLNTLLLVGFTSAYAEDFTAGGFEPSWSLTIKHKTGNTYQATLSRELTEVKAVVTRIDRKGYTLFKGQGSDGRPLTIKAIEKSCVNDGKGDISSYTVDVKDRFEGCGDFENPQQSAWAQAKALNAKGYRHYKRGHYKQALLLFQHAREADWNYVLGHYNFACTAAIMMRNNKCITDGDLVDLADVDTVFAALKQSIKLDPKRKAKMQTDPDLSQLRKTYEYYRRVLGYSPNNNRQLKEMLQKLEWTQAHGFYPHHGKPATIRFRGNQVIVTDNRGNQQKGTYTVSNGSIRVTVKGKRLTGKLIADADLGWTLLQFKGKGLPFNDFTPSVHLSDISRCDDGE